MEILLVFFIFFLQCLSFNASGQREDYVIQLITKDITYNPQVKENIDITNSMKAKKKRTNKINEVDSLHASRKEKKKRSASLCNQSMCHS